MSHFGPSDENSKVEFEQFNQQLECYYENSMYRRTSVEIKKKRHRDFSTTESTHVDKSSKTAKVSKFSKNTDLREFLRSNVTRVPSANRYKDSYQMEDCSKVVTTGAKGKPKRKLPDSQSKAAP